jgi:zinc/manganese transport system permease protein
MGMVYAAASAAAVLVVAKTPHGDADFLHLLFGNILGVTNGQVVVLAGLAIGVALWRFFTRRLDPAAIGRGSTFAFYLLLGGAIAAAIRSAGVLLVFTYLVAPALVILMFRVERGAALLAVITSASCGVLGLWGSYRWDLPSGSAIVAAFGAWLAVTAAAAAMRRKAQGDVGV